MVQKQFKPTVVFLIALLATLVLSACDAEASKPTAVIVSPPSGSQYKDGEEVAVQSASIDSKGIVRVELIVDNQIVRTDASPVPAGQSSLNLIQTWKATPGTHTILVRAYNAAGAMSDPVAVSITVQQAGAPPPAASTAAASSSVASSSSVAASSSASSSASSVASSAAPECTNNAAFVADVTIPDGTSINAGQAFNKTWRVSNNGTCAWNVGHQFVFVSGEAMTPSTVNPVPNTSPGATADLIVPLTAPTPPGNHSGQWKLRAPNGSLFGQSVSVKINVPAPPGSSSSASSVASAPATCSGSPTIPSFTATSTTINKGSSTKLEWGAVANADAVDIEPGIGGIGTPGNATVAPATTTTYTLTAHCGANTSTKQVKVTVNLLGGIYTINPGVLQLLFTVTSVTAEVSFKNFCVKGSPQGVLFNGYITTNRAGTIKYKWVPSNGAATAVTDLVFDKAETNVVLYSHSFSSSGWAQLQVTSPNSKNSNQVNVTYNCIDLKPGFP